MCEHVFKPLSSASNIFSIASIISTRNCIQLQMFEKSSFFLFYFERFEAIWDGKKCFLLLFSNVNNPIIRENLQVIAGNQSTHEKTKSDRVPRSTLIFWV